ncbi:MAG TPA: hypothetical protein VGY55_01120 [Pirellulales bacterium]|jgi:hypothetical protein|nr:hypothetical protein [Pirellulales bacterium]
MPVHPHDDWGSVCFLIYCLIGLPVVWLHVRQQRMIESTKQSRQSGIVVYTLAVMWPLLLFAMLLNYWQSSPRSRKPKPDDPSQKRST